MVPVTIVLPADPERLELGGIASFVRGFVKFAPSDFELSFVGIASGDRPLGVGHWAEIELEGRGLRFLPVTRRATTRRGRVPLALGFTVALARRRGAIPQRSVLQFHRPATALPLLRRSQAKIRVVHLTTDQLRSVGSESRWRLAGPALDRLEARTFAAMDRIYVVNEATAMAYRARYPALEGRIAFVANWVDDTIFRPPSATEREARRAELRASLGLDPAARVVLFAGRLEGQKDPELLLDAFLRLRTTEPTAALLIVGSGGLRKAMQRRVTAAGVAEVVRIREPVDRPALAGLMASADVLAVTSRFETGPTIAYEALATGLPVVGSAVGRIRSLVGEGEGGAVVEGRDPQAFADALRAVLGAPSLPQRQASIRAAEPFHARAVLAPVYDDHRRLAVHRGQGLA